jgi:hypothetical protein
MFGKAEQNLFWQYLTPFARLPLKGEKERRSNLCKYRNPKPIRNESSPGMTPEEVAEPSLYIYIPGRFKKENCHQTIAMCFQGKHWTGP